MIWVTILLGAALTAVGLIFMEPVARLLGADENIFGDCVRYGRIVVAFTVMYMLQNVFQSFLVAAEKPKLGLAVTGVAGVTNMVLDALFIVGLDWGVAGAAAATGISQCVGGLIPLVYFLCPNKSRLRMTRTRLSLRPILQACGNGSSELMSNVSASLVSMLYNHQLLRYFDGNDGIAAYGVLMYVQFIFVAIYVGYAVGVSPVVSYAYGALSAGRAAELAPQELAAHGDSRCPADGPGLWAGCSAGQAVRPLQPDGIPADGRCLPDVCLLLPAGWDQYIPVSLLYGLEQRRGLGGDLVFADADLPDGGRDRPAPAGRPGRGLVGSRGGRGRGFPDIGLFFGRNAEEIQVLVGEGVRALSAGRVKLRAGRRDSGEASACRIQIVQKPSPAKGEGFSVALTARIRSVPAPPRSAKDGCT